MPSIKEFFTHLRQVYSSRGGKMILIILLLSGAILGGVFIGLNLHSIPPLSGIWSIVITAVGFIFSFSFVATIFLLSLPIVEANKQMEVVTTPKSNPDKAINHKEQDRFYIWSRRISLAGTLLIAFIVYILGWFFVIKSLVLPTIHQISSGPILWEMGTAPNSIGSIVIGFMMLTLWAIMPFMLYMDFYKKQRKRNTKNNQGK